MHRQRIVEVKDHFKENYLNVTEDWIEECVTWALENKPAHEQTFLKLKEFAYDQWLLGDLSEIGNGCLPTNLKDQKLVVLSGKYTLQAESFIDCANSYYNQLKVKRGGLLELEEQQDEIEVAAELSEWGQGPKEQRKALKPRKLIFQFSDGKQKISGLEYKPLTAFRGKILPGVKILICGPIECRRGMLMLEPKHLKVLGGEIDMMMVPNAPENVLARKLNLQETNEPYVDGASTVAEPRKENAPQGREVARVAPSGTSSSRPLPSAPRATVQSTVRRPNPPPTLPSQSRAPQSKQWQSTQGQQQQIPNFDDMDDFDISEEDLLNLEQESSRILATSQSQHQNKHVQQLTPVIENDNSDMDFYDSELEAQLLAEDEIFSASNKSKENKNSVTQTLKSPSGEMKSAPTVKLPPRPRAHVANIDVIGIDDDDDDFNNMDIWEEFSAVPTTKVSSRKPTSSNLSTKSSGANKSLSNQYVDNSNYGYNSSVVNSNKIKDQTSLNTIETMADSNKAISRNVPPYASVFNKAKTNQTSSEPPSKKIKAVQEDIRSFASKPSELVTHNSDSITRRTEQKPNISAFLGRGAALSKECNIERKETPSCQLISAWPFVYLEQLQEPNLRPARATVKACVVSVVTKLRKDDGVWQLVVRIDDGSSQMNVDFSNEVLERILGFSVFEYEAMKIAARENELIGEKMNEGMQCLRSKLIDVICLMEIDFEENDVPVVVQLTDLDENHLKEMKSRQLHLK